MFKKSLVLSMLLGLVFVGGSASASYTAKAGDLLRTADDATVVLVMDDGLRVPISADAYLVRYDNNFSLVKTVTLAERGSYNSDLLTLNSTISLPSGTVFMYNINTPGIFKIENGYKRLFSTLTGFMNGGNNLNAVQWVGGSTLYPTGSPLQ